VNKTIEDVKNGVGVGRFAHIYPHYIDPPEGQKRAYDDKRVSLVLAHHLHGHLTNPDANLTGYWNMTVDHIDSKELVIVDNGAFEKATLSISQLLDVTEELVRVTDKKFAVIAPDFPGEDAEIGWRAARDFNQALIERKLRDRVFVFFVPQGLPGQPDDIADGLFFARDADWIDGVCISILASPIAIYGGSSSSSKRVMAQFTCDARIKLINYLIDTEPKLVESIWDKKYVHFLGLFNWPEEVDMWSRYPNSFDSAAPLKIAALVAGGHNWGGVAECSPKLEVDVISQSGQVLETVRNSKEAQAVIDEIIDYILGS
jgi:hypothetical protein